MKIIFKIWTSKQKGKSLKNNLILPITMKDEKSSWILKSHGVSNKKLQLLDAESSSLNGPSMKKISF